MSNTKSRNVEHADIVIPELLKTNTQAEVARMLNVSRGYVNRYVKKKTKGSEVQDKLQHLSIGMSIPKTGHQDAVWWRAARNIGIKISLACDMITRVK